MSRNLSAPVNIPVDIPVPRRCGEDDGGDDRAMHPPKRRPRTHRAQVSAVGRTPSAPDDVAAGPRSQSTGSPIRYPRAPVALPAHLGPWTVADLDSTPDDGNRWELIDGTFIVTPAPGGFHQRTVARLFEVLLGSAPTGVEVLVAPTAVVLADDTAPEPDVVVAVGETLGPRGIAGPPLLVAEVLSPSTRRYDLLLKRDVYAGAGIGWYWLVDPDEPRVTILRLEGEAYVEHLQAGPRDVVTLDEPFPVSFSVARLAQPR